MPRTTSHLAVFTLVRALHKLGTVLARPSGPHRFIAEADEPEEEPGSTGFWLKLLLSSGLVLLGGVFAGSVPLQLLF